MSSFLLVSSIFQKILIFFLCSSIFSPSFLMLWHLLIIFIFFVFVFSIVGQRFELRSGICNANYRIIMKTTTRMTWWKSKKYCDWKLTEIMTTPESTRCPIISQCCPRDERLSRFRKATTFLKNNRVTFRTADFCLEYDQNQDSAMMRDPHFKSLVCSMSMPKLSSLAFPHHTGRATWNVIILFVYLNV